MSSLQRRKIHIDIPLAIHRKLRVKAAYEDVTIQELVSNLIASAVVDVELPEQNIPAKKEKR